MAKIVLYYLLPLALMVYALVDCAQDDDVERTSVPKALWIVMVILLPYAGPIAWLVVAKIARPRQGGNSGRSNRPGWFGGGSRNSRPMGPDDDPEFLRRLAEEQRRKKRQEGRGEPGGLGSDR